VRFLVLSLIFLVGTAFGQSYPTKPVRLIVTYPPGGSSDLMSRVYGAKLSEVWNQPVIIESKPGAAGSIGMDFAAKQPGDGYTFVVGNLQPVAVNPLLSQVTSSRSRRSRRVPTCWWCRPIRLSNPSAT
jgi:tripartite-type tricarboxylate transporter receptor subunit TctC